MVMRRHIGMDTPAFCYLFHY